MKNNLQSETGLTGVFEVFEVISNIGDKEKEGEEEADEPASYPSAARL